MKSDKQFRDSYKFAFIGYVGMTVITIIMGIMAQL